MNPERYQRVKELFLAATELEENKIADFLDEACAGDLALRREVESLLGYHFSTTIMAQPGEPSEPGKIRSPVSPASSEQTTVAPGSSGQTGARQATRKARFSTGTIIAGRYRILGLLGRGGMGEVFRAEDLKLEQEVALKFLARGRSKDQAWLERFRNEVRLARKVTHPNVTRVYDLGEADGEVFISMEYVDGEDLVSLLRRIGRFSGERALEITRQLCAGLGAAHDQGVLHRDLKPANVMIDSQGQVRITDFGIAALAEESERPVPIAGTPAFMAPELFQGQEPSVRSDLYSLGIVLYELVTGKEPFDGEPANQDREPPALASPSTPCSDVDPALQRAILACLEPDPRRRPESTHAILAALPGGDPLSAALAAGETPSPGMVAAAGTGSGISPKWAVGLLVVALLGLLVVVLLADWTFFIPQAGLDKPPAVLADRAQEIIRSLGHEPAVQGTVQGLAIDRDYLDYMLAQKDPGRNWDQLACGRPPAVFFWYREGDNRLLPPAPFGEPTLVRKLPAEPGMNTVRLDGQGRLLHFAAMAPLSRMAAHSVDVPNWDKLFQRAGLDRSKFTPIEPVRPPPMYADHVVAWRGAYPENPDAPIRVEAASEGGEVVYFHIVQPWDLKREAAGETTLPARILSRTFTVRFLFYMTALLGGIVLAWRNLRLGRGDQRGAWRLALFVATLAMLDWLLGQRHVGVFSEEAASCYLWMARATFQGAVTWVCYIGLEPYVRRLWPHTMITWSRLLAGKFRDPLLGRDLLVGGLFGIGIVLVMQFDTLLPAWLQMPEPVPKLPGVGYELGEILGIRYKLGGVVRVLMQAITFSLVATLLMLLLRTAIRRPVWAAAAFCLLMTGALAAVSAYDTFLPVLANFVVVVGLVIVLVRVGLVAVIAGWFVASLLSTAPVTSDFSAWYAPAGNFAVALVAILLIYGFYAALAGRPILTHRLLQD